MKNQIKVPLNMIRAAGTYEKSTTLGEEVNAFVPFALPPSTPSIDPHIYGELNRKAEMALARLSGVSGLVPSVDWLLYSAIRKEALLTSQIEGTQATITDLFDEEAGLDVSNTDDVEEVTNYIAAYKLVRENLRDPKGLPISVRLMCEAHKLLLNGVRGTGKQPGDLRRSQNWIGGTRPGNAVLFHRLRRKFQGYSVTWKNLSMITQSADLPCRAKRGHCLHWSSLHWCTHSSRRFTHSWMETDVLGGC